MQVPDKFELMHFDHINLEVDNHSLVVSIASGHTANAFCLDTMKELIEVAERIDAEPRLRSVILKGTDRIFTGGMDLNNPVVLNPTKQPLSQLRNGANLGQKMCRAWEKLDAITVSAIEGYCVGAGVALSLALDFRVCAANSVMYVPEIERGMNMSWQSVPRSVNLIGPAKTKRMFILAEKVDGTRALNWGWADYLAEDGKALSVAQDIAENANNKPPLAVSMCKQAINHATNALNDAVSFMDTEQFVLTQHSQDYAEGIESYLQKRKPKYTGN